MVSIFCGTTRRPGHGLDKRGGSRRRLDDSPSHTTAPLQPKVPSISVPTANILSIDSIHRQSSTRTHLELVDARWSKPGGAAAIRHPKEASTRITPYIRPVLNGNARGSIRDEQSEIGPCSHIPAAPTRRLLDVLRRPSATVRYASRNRTRFRRRPTDANARKKSSTLLKKQGRPRIDGHHHGLFVCQIHRGGMWFPINASKASYIIRSRVRERGGHTRQRTTTSTATRSRSELARPARNAARAPAILCAVCAARQHLLWAVDRAHPPLHHAAAL